MTDLELAWLAGILEGEAHFRADNSAGHRNYAQVRVQMTDLDVIERIAALIGSNVSGPRNMRKTLKDGGPPKPLYEAAAHGTRARALMRALYPHMGNRRREKIREILGDQLDLLE